MARYPVTEPFERGMLDVGDGHLVSWRVAGNPAGKPVVVLHGGPGGPMTRGSRMFDPARYRIVQFDQRQCGSSTPSASEPVVDLSTNTTAHLVADIEMLREHLGIERWVVWGGSWGTLLGLVYAEAFPSRVEAMVLASVVGSSRADVEWITRSMGRVFPAQWERFRDHLPPADRDGDLAAAYARLLQDPDPAVHLPAAAAWCTWEDTHVATAPGHTHDTRFDDPAFSLCFARLVTHYWSNGCFVDEGQVLRDAHRLTGIPIVMVNGQLDISGPPDHAWQLAQVLPDAELVIIGDEGHGGAGSTADVVIAATDRFAARSGRK